VRKLKKVNGNAFCRRKKMQPKQPFRSCSFQSNRYCSVNYKTELKVLSQTRIPVASWGVEKLYIFLGVITNLFDTCIDK
jgi:hypothetical protein